MDSDTPFSLLITWTCYGTWLPGDTRGYVSNTLKPSGEIQLRENTPGTPYTRNDSFTYQQSRRRQKHSTVWLTLNQSRSAADAIVLASRERDWQILRGAIMANHIHLIVADCPADGPTVRRVLKGVSQAALTGHNGASRRWWTKGGSDRYMNDDRSIMSAIKYVENQQRPLVKIVDTIVS